MENSSIPPLSKEQIIKYIDKYRNDLHSNDATRLHALINAFIGTDWSLLVRLVRIELTPLAPEANALSTGLQAHIIGTGFIIAYLLIHVQLNPNFTKWKVIRRIMPVYFCGVFV